MPIRLPLFTTSSNQPSLTIPDNLIWCHKKNSWKQWNSPSFTIKPSPIKIPLTQPFTSFTWLQIFGLLSWTMLLPSNQQEWRQWRMRQRTLKKSSKTLLFNTTRQDRPELQWSWSKLSPVLPPCEMVSKQYQTKYVFLVHIKSIYLKSKYIHAYTKSHHLLFIFLGFWGFGVGIGLYGI